MAGDPAGPWGGAMTALPILLDHQRAARWQAMIDTMAIGLPGVMVAGALAGRLFGVATALGVGSVALVALAVVAVRLARRLDRGWLIGELDARLPRFEDSSALLFTDPRVLGGLAGLQRARLEARIADATAVDLRPGWSPGRIAGAWGVGAALILAIALWPAPVRPSAPGQPSVGRSSPASPPRITAVRLRITPPAYTGLPVREQAALDARLPEGSRVDWVLDFAPSPASANLAFPESGPAPLIQDGARWTGTRIVDRPMLYRIEANGLTRQRLHRLDAIADAAPVVQLVAPASQLVIVTLGQGRWTPVFEASDDYGVAGSASLRITVTKGDGENITFVRRAMALRGQGEALRKRFSTTLDLAREGLAPSGDLIVQLVVSDNRTPGAQIVEGPSVILRWPADLAGVEGLDGMALSVMPAYFRSQRQIIIDAEALIAQRRRIDADQFMSRSNGLGADQADLRLRYGQFMGEESEGGGGGGIALPTNDAPVRRPALPTNDAPAPAAARPEPDDHDHAGEATPRGLGGQVDVLREFGHAHDTGDAATLFDPGTRSTLSLALDAMWSSERALRQGKPDEALPFAYRALEFLKQAQQASRIFLARVGSNLPPIDLSRRLSGERDDIVAGTLVSSARPAADAAPAEAWRALEDRPGRTGPVPLAALDRWVRDNRARLADPLALAAAIDTVRNEPDCLTCRRRLRALLWSALGRPPVTVRRREAPATRGQRYLDALR